MCESGHRYARPIVVVASAISSKHPTTADAGVVRGEYTTWRRRNAERWWWTQRRRRWKRPGTTTAGATARDVSSSGPGRVAIVASSTPSCYPTPYTTTTDVHEWQCQQQGIANGTIHCAIPMCISGYAAIVASTMPG